MPDTFIIDKTNNVARWKERTGHFFVEVLRLLSTLSLPTGAPKEARVLNLTLITMVNSRHWKILATLMKPTRGSIFPLDDSCDD